MTFHPQSRRVQIRLNTEQSAGLTNALDDRGEEVSVVARRDLLRYYQVVQAAVPVLETTAQASRLWATWQAGKRSALDLLEFVGETEIQHQKVGVVALVDALERVERSVREPGDRHEVFAAMVRVGLLASTGDTQ